MRLTHLIAIIPCLALLFAPFIANRVEPRVLGLPFLLFWIMLWIVLTTGFMSIVFLLEKNKTDE